jgi:putative redox protein
MDNNQSHFKVSYKGNLRTEAVHIKSNNTLITDAPIDNKGKGEAFSPTDLMCTSLGACMLTIMGISANENNYSIAGTEIFITKIMESNPRRVGGIILQLIIPQDKLSDNEKRMIENAALHCPVAKSIHPNIKLDVSFEYK